MSDNINSPNRREFLKIAGMSATYAGCSSFLFQGCSNDAIPKSDHDLYGIFKEPDAEARPFFRWWWNGNAVTKDEISRELKIIKEAGAGGVEINPIAMPEEAQNPESGLVWLSDEWCKMLVHSVGEAKKLGLVTDLIVGTGWPFGGEFIKPEETLQGLTFESFIFTGPGMKSIKIALPEDEHEKILRIILIPDSFKDLSDAKELTDNMNKNDTLKFEIAEGDHTLMIIKWRNKFRTVLHGSPGGWVMRLALSCSLLWS